ncbi:hypothetical protein NP493_20g02003 [Ridgeia piscesae]|uniref:dihydrofolate reductase n=1 Tax=Ridgeia piscesae TaxID=27915 RepID=A0AAD9UKS6_RIDPI|nr:hypothetical protein NP493_20g02003 [Ridgeia piscesae]
MGKHVKLNLIVATCNNGGIGMRGELPWRIRGDLAFFKRITTETSQPDKQNAVIMGRKTWESIPEKFRPLQKRINVILSRHPQKQPDGVYVAGSFDEAINLLTSMPLVDKVDKLFVIGGSSVYKTALQSPLCERIYLTRVLGDFECDAFLPEFDTDIFKHINVPEINSAVQTENKMDFKFEVYEKPWLKRMLCPQCVQSDGVWTRADDTSRGTDDTSPGADDTSPWADDTNPGVDDTSPGADDTSPGADDTSPGADDTSPGADDTSPGADDTSPGADDTSPGADDTSPGADDTSPGADDTSPGADDTSPGADDTSPGADDTSPGTDDTSPGTDDTSPGADDTSPGADDTSPGTDDTSPGADDTSPGADDTSPGADDTSPGADDTSPGTDDTSPGADDTSPGAVL